MNNDKLAERLELWGFENGISIFEDGSYGFALELTPLDISCWSDEQTNSLAQRIDQFLNGLPSHIDLQWVQDIEGSSNKKTIESHRHSISGDADPVAIELSNYRLTSLAELDKNGLLPFHRLRLFIRRSQTKSSVEKPSVFKKKTSFNDILEARLTKEIRETQRLKDDICQSLRALEFQVQEITEEEIVQWMYDQWNPDRGIPLAGYNPEDIRSSILFSDIDIGHTSFSIGNIHHRLISLKALPSQSFAGMTQALRTLPFGSRLCCSIHVPDQQQELAKLQTQRRLAFSMAHGKTHGVSDIESETKLNDIESLLEEMIAQGQKVFHMSFNIILSSTDPLALEDQVSETLLKLREINGAEGMAETLATFDIFKQLSIPNAKSRERAKLMKTSFLSDFLPVFGPWQGTERSSLLLRNRLGSLTKFDPFSNSFTNYNQIVSGGSGSGKSFLTNVLVLQMLKEKPKVFIIDIGGSYKKLCENINGQYIELNVNSGISINPFDLPDGESQPSNQKIKFLVGLVELMAKENDDLPMNRYQKAEIEQAIGVCFDKHPSPRLSNLRQELLSHPDIEMVRLGKILNSWCGETPFGRFVDKPTTVGLKSSTICFDLKGMETYPDLQAVCLFLITDLVWREVQIDRGQKKFVVFDECWKLLENDAGSAFIAEVFRTFRKYYASAIAISQNVDDFAKSKVATAILSNSSVKWILRQKGADQDRLKEVLRLNENEIHLISSLSQSRGEYSEAFLMAEDQKCVVVIEPTPLEYWIATTDPRDLALMDECKADEGLSGLDLLKHLAKVYPTGASTGTGGEK